MRLTRDDPAEWVIVGAGVIGLALAYELLRRGSRVRVLERESPGAGASAAAAGMLAPVFEADGEDPELTRFGQDSLARYPAFVRGLEELTGCSCGYDGTGTLAVGVRLDHRGELRRLRENLIAQGLAPRELRPEELLALEPHLAGRVTGGLWIGQDHQVDPRCLVRALAAAVQRLGGRMEAGRRVTEIRAAGGALCELVGEETGGAPFAFPARRAVLAAGAFSSADLRTPLGDLGLRPVKGQLVRLRGPRLLTHVVRTPEVYLVPRADGELLVGATVEEMGFDTTPTAGAVLDLLRHAWEVLPAIYELELAEVSVGLRAAVDDQLPVIGPTEIDGLFLALGHHRNGILLAPATAHHLAGALIEGGAPVELAAFDPRRLQRPAAQVPRRTQ